MLDDFPSPRRQGTAPDVVAAICLAAALAAVCGWLGFSALKAALPLLGQGEFAFVFGWLAAMVGLFFGALTFVYGWIARRLPQGEPTARWEAVVLAGVLVLAAWLSDAVVGWQWQAFVVGNLALAAVCAFGPGVRERAEQGSLGGVPLPLALAVTVARFQGFTLMALGAAVLPGGRFESRIVVNGLLYLALGVAVLVLCRSVLGRSWPAAVALAVLPTVGTVVALVHDAQLLSLVHVGLTAVVVGGLVGAASSRAFLRDDAAPAAVAAPAPAPTPAPAPAPLPTAFAAPLPVTPFPPSPPAPAVAPPPGWAVPPAPALPELVLDTGRVVPLGPLVLVGRAPEPAGPHEADAVLVAVDDPDRSLSKTHAALGISDDGTVWVEDRGSTNGSAVLDDAGRPTLLVPRLRTALPADAVLQLGDRTARLQPATAAADTTLLRQTAMAPAVPEATTWQPPPTVPEPTAWQPAPPPTGWQPAVPEPTAPPAVEPPSLGWPILLGVPGALVASSRARQRGLPTARYWQAAAASTAAGLVLGLAVPLGLLAALAGSDGSGEDDVTLAEPVSAPQPVDPKTYEPVEPEPYEPEPVAPAPPLTRSTFVAVGPDGTRIEGTVGVSAFQRARDAAGVEGAFRAGVLPCEVDPARDAVALATFAFTNGTPDFPVEDFRLAVEAEEGVESGALALGVEYTEDTPCDDGSSYGSSRSVRPKFADGTTTWGVVQSVLVARDVYAPSAPDGDRAVLTGTVLRLVPTLAGLSMQVAAATGTLAAVEGSGWFASGDTALTWPVGGSRPAGDLPVGDVPPTALPTGTRLCVADTTSLNLREGPGLDQPVVTEIPVARCDVIDAGRTVSTDGEQRVWRYVTWQSRTGWVSNRMLTLD